MEDRTGHSRRRDRGDLLLGALNYVYSVLHAPLLGSPFFRKRGGCVLKDPPRLRIGEVFSLSVGSQIMVASEPVLEDALPYLLNSGIIRNVI